MNILVIGNGFDLAHGLPTKYTDFLEWVKIILRIKSWLEFDDKIPTKIGELDNWLMDNTKSKKCAIKFDDEIKDCIDSDIYRSITDFLDACPYDFDYYDNGWLVYDKKKKKHG